METEADKEANRSLFGCDDEDDEGDENAEGDFHDTPALFFSSAPSTVRPLARDLRVLVGWPFPLSFGFWSGRALATGTAWAGLCLIHHHHRIFFVKARIFI